MLVSLSVGLVEQGKRTLGGFLVREKWNSFYGDRGLICNNVFVVFAILCF